MGSSFDPRIVAPQLVALTRAMQQSVPCVLGGGAALSGIYLRHRLSRDLDLFCATRDDVRTLALTIGELASQQSYRARIVRDAGTFVRAVLEAENQEPVELDLVLETTPPVEPPQQSAEGVTVAALADLRAAKVTCLLSRSEPRDLVSAELALTYWARAEPKLRRTILSEPERAALWSSFKELQKAPLVPGAVNTRAVIRFRTSHGEHWIAFDQECRLVQVDSHACFAMSKPLMRQLVASLPADARAEMLATPGRCAGYLPPP